MFISTYWTAGYWSGGYWLPLYWPIMRDGCPLVAAAESDVYGVLASVPLTIVTANAPVTRVLATAPTLGVTVTAFGDLEVEVRACL